MVSENNNEVTMKINVSFFFVTTKTISRPSLPFGGVRGFLKTTVSWNTMNVLLGTLGQPFICAIIEDQPLGV